MKFLVVVLALISVAHAQYYSVCNGQSQWQVRSGNTFYNLANQDWGTMCAFLNANPGVDPCNLQIGQVINCPSTYTSTVCTAQDLSWRCVSAIGIAPSGYYGTGTYGSYYNNYYNNGGYYYNNGYTCPAGCYGVFSIPSGFTYYNAANQNSNCAWSIASCNPSYNANALVVGAPLCLPTSNCATGASAYYGMAAYNYGK